jgi:hypothetical protein
MRSEIRRKTKYQNFLKMVIQFVVCEEDKRQEPNYYFTVSQTLLPLHFW